jgi:hypothetical protein
MVPRRIQVWTLQDGACNAIPAKTTQQLLAIGTHNALGITAEKCARQRLG